MTRAAHGISALAFGTACLPAVEHGLLKLDESARPVRAVVRRSRGRIREWRRCRRCLRSSLIVRQMRYSSIEPMVLCNLRSIAD